MADYIPSSFCAQCTNMEVHVNKYLLRHLQVPLESCRLHVLARVLVPALEAD